ncbi:hypothetical protein DBY65_017365 [Pseudomonas sp. RIT412]|nr:hypothetical protein DBP26_010485 [Pseudomonas sp. RIT 409]RAU52402.1 hypothetical protein DBY65_017365 [Pseudomonas sp. RIT 412]
MTPDSDRGLYVVTDSQGQAVIVLGRGSWIDVHPAKMTNKVVVSSFVVDFAAGRREKVETLVDLDFNPTLLETLRRWKSLDKDLEDQF